MKLAITLLALGSAILLTHQLSDDGSINTDLQAAEEGQLVRTRVKRDKSIIINFGGGGGGGNNGNKGGNKKGGNKGGGNKGRGNKGRGNKGGNNKNKNNNGNDVQQDNYNNGGRAGDSGAGGAGGGSNAGRAFDDDNDGDDDDEECEDEDNGGNNGGNARATFPQVTNPPTTTTTTTRATTTTIATTTVSPDAANCEIIQCNFDFGTMCYWENAIDLRIGYINWEVQSAGIGNFDSGVPFTSSATNKKYLGAVIGNQDKIVVKVGGLNITKKRYLKFRYYLYITGSLFWVALNNPNNTELREDSGFQTTSWEERLVALKPGTTQIYIGASSYYNYGGVGIDDLTIVDVNGQSLC